MKKIVIVGSGMAGLAAAVRLAGTDRSVHLLEQAPRSGGRTYSFLEKTTGDVIDNGQHLLLDCYTQTLEYIKTIGTEHLISVEPELELSFVHPVWGSSRVRISRKLNTKAALISGLSGYSFLSFSDRLKLLKAGHTLFSLREEDISRYAGMTVEDLLNSLKQSERCKSCFWYPLAVAVMNESTKLASAEVFIRAIKIAIFDEKGPASIVTPLRGLSEVFITPAERYIAANGGKVTYHQRVTGFIKNGGAVEGVSLQSGETVTGDVFILTGQPAHVRPLLGEIGITLPDAISYVPIITCNIWFNKPLDIPPRIGMIGSVYQWVFRKEEGYLSLVMSGAREHASTDTGKLLDLALGELRSCFPQLRNASVAHHTIIKEKRATVSITPELQPQRPGVVTSYPNVFIAGDWTQTYLPATIEGAIISGFRAADLIMNSG